MPELVEWVANLFSNTVHIAALVLGGALTLMGAVMFLFIVWKILTHWANRVAQRLIDLHTLFKVQRLYAEAKEGSLVGLERVTRVEVLDSKGRSYAKWGLKDVHASWQDQGRTLKLLLEEEPHEEGV